MIVVAGAEFDADITIKYWVVAGRLEAALDGCDQVREKEEEEWEVASRCGHSKLVVPE